MICLFFTPPKEHNFTRIYYSFHFVFKEKRNYCIYRCIKNNQVVVRRELRLHLPKKGVLVHRKTDHAFVRRVWASTFSLTRTDNLTRRSKINFLSQTSRARKRKKRKRSRNRKENRCNTHQRVSIHLGPWKNLKYRLLWTRDLI